MTTEPRLRELEDALAAATPGPWRYPVGGGVATTGSATERQIVIAAQGELRLEDARYLAAASPDVIRALLDSRRDALLWIKRLRRWYGIDTLSEAGASGPEIEMWQEIGRALSDTPQEAR